ncbi:Lrp/AsnC family transcriptional regulator [Streptomyces sp. NPDC058812]|uniref:Lrp/AsnC family transcriptional regulator n=1 Tax=unclassified Streptomyces TaxID=2593676 RepID=UPI003679E3C5
MQESATLTEADLALANALQLDPRAPWSRLAGPLGLDPATLSRRWARLRASGSAWVTCYPGGAQAEYAAFALVQVACAPGTCEETAALLSGDGRVYSVEITAGAFGLLLTVAALDHASLAAYVLRRLGRLPGITGTRTHLVQRIYREASRWRMDALSQRQQRGLERAAAERAGAEPAGVDEQRLVIALAADGRQSYAQLGETLGKPESTVRRTLAAALGSGRAVVRCETAHLMAGWRVTATLWLAVPPGELEQTAETLCAMRQARLVCSVAGEANLLVQVWLHGLGELSRFEAQLAERRPAARVLERSVTFTWVKRMGRVLDALGRSLAYVPMNVRDGDRTSRGG